MADEIQNKQEVFPTGQQLLYKLDRTLAIFGVIAIALCAMFILGADGKEIAIAGAGVLGGYVGGRATK
jgi:hypothetical protein